MFFRFLFILSALFSGLISCTNTIPEVRVLNPGNLGIISFQNEVVLNNQIYLKAPLVQVSSQFFGPVTDIAIIEGPTCDSATWTDLKTPVSLTLSSGDGPKILSFRYRNSSLVFDCQSITVVLDQTAPNAPSSLTLNTPATSSGNVATPIVIVGGVVIGDTVKLYSDISCTTQIGSSLSAGTTVNINSSSLSAGVYTLYANSTDPVGNVSSCSIANVSYTYVNFAPTILSVTTSTQSGNYGLGNLIQIEVLFSEPVYVTSNPVLALNISPTVGKAIYVSGAGTNTYLFNYTVSPGDNANALDYASSSAFTLSGAGNVTDAAGNIADLTLPILGVNSLSPAKNIVIDTTAPVAPSGLSLKNPVSSPSAISIPTLTVNGVNLNDVVKIYSSNTCNAGQILGAGTVANGTSLNILLSSALVVGSYSFYAQSTDLAGNASPCSTANVSYIYDPTPPVTTNITASNAAGSYGAATNISIEITFSKNVTLAGGTPTLALNTTPARSATYVSGNGASTFIFNYTVSAGDNTTPSTVLDYAGTSSFNLNGGTLVDSATGTPADLTLPTPGGPGSLAANKAIQIDTTAVNISPTITIGNPSPSFGSSTTAFVWPVTYTNAASITLVSANITLLGATAGCSLAVGEGLTANVKNIIITNCTGSGSLTFSIASGTASDSSGNLFPAPGVSGAVTVDQQIYTIQFANPSDATFEGDTINTQGISLTIDPPPPRDVTVNFNVNSAATTAAPADFSLPLLRSVTFLANSTSTSIDYTYHGNTTLEISKIIQLDISSINGPVNSRVGLNQRVQRLIKDDDNPNILPATFDGFAKIAAGGSHTCGITISGAMKCWGDNRFGQLGSGLNAPGAVPQSNTPLVIDLLTKYSQVTAGGSHTCGLASVNINTPGKLNCWGDNTYGQLGSGPNSAGTAPQSNTPLKIDPGTNYKQISAGANHTCGITDGGKVKCWGDNSKGQLGIGPAIGSTNQIIFSPTQIDDSTTIYLQVAAGTNHTCGITSANVLKCWGDNTNGQLGSGDSLPPTTPLVIVDPGILYQNISAGTTYTCGTTTGGVLKCWGDNFLGLLGNGLPTPSYSPLMIDSANLYATISAGSTHSCGITLTGELKCWGDNSAGELGNGHYLNSHKPSVMDATTSYSQVSAGGSHTCGINSTGSLKCWGDNISNQLGNGQSLQSYAPLVIDAETNYRQVSAGTSHTCGITLNGVLKCWGKNMSGQLGNGLYSNANTPFVIDSLTSYLQISAGASHTCGITSKRDLKCWGDNPNGELGYGSPTATPQSAIPLTIDPGINYSQVALGVSHTCGIVAANANAAGVLKCWGDNSKGQLGYGPPTATPQSAKPLAIDPGISYSQVALGAYHTCAITSAGELKCWGDNSNGQLGYGPPTATSQSNVPLNIDSANTYLKVSAGPRHTCAITSTGVLKCWGDNSKGQLGYGPQSSILTSNTPIEVDPGIIYKDVSTGSGHTCGVTQANELKCWGDNFYGQLGNGIWTNLPGLVIQ